MHYTSFPVASPHQVRNKLASSPLKLGLGLNLPIERVGVCKAYTTATNSRLQTGQD